MDRLSFEDCVLSSDDEELVPSFRQPKVLNAHINYSESIFPTKDIILSESRFGYPKDSNSVPISCISSPSKTTPLYVSTDPKNFNVTGVFGSNTHTPFETSQLQESQMSVLSDYDHIKVSWA